ncbi:hypothetical protein Mgra_00006687 [Meloidogyne graminicola]|uniref:Uncharacterized protein n=1 Tax=Meloidogyne graminicola TaxID=189291 RepID=A0A8S9ZKX8_9BILA|nr:hypothetical protein Mgra_00006687 [Meloidogyne graminicola]
MKRRRLFFLMIILWNYRH